MDLRDLPVEIRQRVFAHLDTSAFAALRSCSKSFGFVTRILFETLRFSAIGDQQAKRLAHIAQFTVAGEVSTLVLQPRIATAEPEPLSPAVMRPVTDSTEGLTSFEPVELALTHGTPELDRRTRSLLQDILLSNAQLRSLDLELAWTFFRHASLPKEAAARLTAVRLSIKPDGKRQKRKGVRISKALKKGLKPFFSQLDALETLSLDFFRMDQQQRHCALSFVVDRGKTWKGLKHLAIINLPCHQDLVPLLERHSDTLETVEPGDASFEGSWEALRNALGKMPTLQTSFWGSIAVTCEGKTKTWDFGDEADDFRSYFAHEEPLPAPCYPRDRRLLAIKGM
ncbi:hypothetical protein NKR23_g12146 [Pleurostoma richardsiae]|jgi:hypothetical protein|uniref:F-box domain-containing protein n=1 Tax=Pleurostoma richardsiae TaxID=41990 RepID=A0AA38R8D5_9PEZI|nr:hypothetical protein NKR23_g12146 [Pleurostoma richardsiae]